MTCVNVRREDKLLVDMLQVWWSRGELGQLTQWDVFSRLLEAALRDPSLPVPPGIRRPVAGRASPRIRPAAVLRDAAEADGEGGEPGEA